VFVYEKSKFDFEKINRIIFGYINYFADCSEFNDFRGID